MNAIPTPAVLKRHPIAAAVLVLLVVSVAAASVHGLRQPVPAAHVADAGDDARLTAGRAIYAQACATCHGRRLQGQALWQVVDADSWRRAPALDATGHSWLRSDEALYQIVATGRLPTQAADAPSGMPAFGARLTRAEIVSTLAFIKSRWPVALAIVQAGLNPPGARPGVRVAGNGWTFPVFCRPGL